MMAIYGTPMMIFLKMKSGIINISTRKTNVWVYDSYGTELSNRVNKYENHHNKHGTWVSMFAAGNGRDSNLYDSMQSKML